MPDNRQNHTNTISNSSNGPIDNVEEGIWRMKLENGNGSYDEKGDSGGGDSSPRYPDRPGEPDCIYFLRTGLCGYGSKCRFNHPSHGAKSVPSKGDLPQRAGQPDCGFYLKTGTCKYGSSCKFHHPNERGTAGQAPLNALGLPIRQESKPCPYYMRTYTCKFGPGCKFNHPQPSSAETILPVSGACAYGTMNSSVYPSVGMPYASGLSAWLLPRSPYLLGPRVPGPPTYAPVVIPSSQGLMTAQGWSTYVCPDLFKWRILQRGLRNRRSRERRLQRRSRRPPSRRRRLTTQLPSASSFSPSPVAPLFAPSSSRLALPHHPSLRSIDFLVTDGLN